MVFGNGYLMYNYVFLRSRKNIMRSIKQVCDAIFFKREQKRRHRENINKHILPIKL